MIILPNCGGQASVKPQGRVVSIIPPEHSFCYNEAIHRMMRTKLLWPFIAVYIAFVAYTNRALLTSRFDAAYWRDKYDHSQWQLPLSSRTIGDDGLYLYEGYRLLAGGDPTQVNAQMPPLGKYAIGLSLALFHNGSVYGCITTLLALCVFFVLARQLLGAGEWAFAATALFAADPLLTNQFPLTMLDSMQLFLFLLFVVLVVRIAQTARPRPAFGGAFVSGCVLGCFASVKFPILAPVVAAGGMSILWKNRQPVKHIVVFFAAAFFGYLLPYAQYFRLGHTPIEWLKIQKWMIAFYQSSDLKPLFGNAVTTIVSGWQKNLFSHAWQRAETWSGTWPTITLLAFFSLVHAFTKHQKNNAIWRIIAFWSCAFLIVFTSVPFWTRYLLLLLPLLYLAAVRVMASMRSRVLAGFLFVCLSAANLAGSFLVIFPTPQKTVQQFLYDWRYGFFQDMYQRITADSAMLYDWKTFQQTGRTFFDDAQIEAVTVEPIDPKWSRFASSQSVRLEITYVTRHLGAFHEETILPVVREDGQWKILWRWDMLIQGLSENSTLSTTLDEASRGTIIASDKTKLAEDFPSVMVSVIPSAVLGPQEEAMFAFLGSLFGGSPAAVALHQRVMGNTLPDLPVPVGVLMQQPDRQQYNKLLSYSAIVLTPHLGRRYRPSNIITVGSVANTSYFECCSRLYTTTTYDGVEGLEKQYNDRLKGKNGGSLTIKDVKGNIVRTILQEDKTNGQDLRL